MSKSLPLLPIGRSATTALFALLTLGACKKELVTAPAPAPVVASIPPPKPDVLVVNAPPLDFRYLQAKGKVQFEMKGDKQEATLAIRMRRDSIIWLSVSKVGIEGARMKITPDSVFVLNKLQKTVFVGSFSALQDRYQVPIDFAMLQAALLANYLPDPSDKDASDGPDAPVQKVKRQQGTLQVEQFINREKHRLVKLEVHDQKTGDGLTANYEDFRPLTSAGGDASAAPAGGREFPYASLLTIQQSPGPQAPADQIRTILVSLNHRNVLQPEGKLDFPFSIPNDYERK